MPSLDDTIDDLYKQPLGDFTRSRNALAKSLAGDDARRVKALAKPTLVPWAVNQVYWRARGAYDRLLEAGEHLRTAQIAALEGKPADVRAASDAHRRAIAGAVGEAERLAGAAGLKPAPDALTRTFETLSLAPEPPERRGRLTGALQPAGFEALAGIAPKASGPAKAGHHRDHGPAEAGHHVLRETVRGVRLQADRDLKRERAEADAARLRAEQARRHEAELKKADGLVAKAEAAEKVARATWERAHDALLDARRARDAVKSSV